MDGTDARRWCPSTNVLPAASARRSIRTIRPSGIVEIAALSRARVRFLGPARTRGPGPRRRRAHELPSPGRVARYRTGTSGPPRTPRVRRPDSSSRRACRRRPARSKAPDCEPALAAHRVGEAGVDEGHVRHGRRAIQTLRDDHLDARRRGAAVAGRPGPRSTCRPGSPPVARGRSRPGSAGDLAPPRR
jgi:hypothetical protein